MTDTGTIRSRLGRSLSAVVEQSQSLQLLRKSDLCCGDLMYVSTCNSIYLIRAGESGACFVSGGWFDKKGVSPLRTTIAGCTWGGSIIKIDVVAACGLCMEFGNKVVTSPIRSIVLVRREHQN